ncbi:hypothetical protein E2C01_073317 [Portunus trituberculatus]|uniref:Uncharacterized protein n=1 Tax=Portunus trituberculatus TaxID=210409 RepID=A0A5B7IA88_PORTR|nr:hypothetical protein [Portunus trituberculatus]
MPISEPSSWVWAPTTTRSTQGSSVGVGRQWAAVRTCLWVIKTPPQRIGPPHTARSPTTHAHDPRLATLPPTIRPSTYEL